MLQTPALLSQALLAHIRQSGPDPVHIKQSGSDPVYTRQSGPDPAHIRQSGPDAGSGFQVKESLESLSTCFSPCATAVPPVAVGAERYSLHQMLCKKLHVTAVERIQHTSVQFSI